MRDCVAQKSFEKIVLLTTSLRNINQDHMILDEYSKLFATFKHCKHFAHALNPSWKALGLWKKFVRRDSALECQCRKISSNIIFWTLSTLALLGHF